MKSIGSSPISTARRARLGRVTAKGVWDVVKAAAADAVIKKLAPYDLQRTCARLCQPRSATSASNRSSGAWSTTPWALSLKRERDWRPATGRTDDRPPLRDYSGAIAAERHHAHLHKTCAPHIRQRRATQRCGTCALQSRSWRQSHHRASSWRQASTGRGSSWPGRRRS